MSVYHHDDARLARRLVVLILAFIGIGLMVGLYYVKVQAQSAQSRVRHLKAAIKQERAAITVVKAELAHFQTPQRLRGLAHHYLDLEPMDLRQIVVLGDIEAKFPSVMKDEDRDLGVKIKGGRP